MCVASRVCLPQIVFTRVSSLSFCESLQTILLPLVTPGASPHLPPPPLLTAVGQVQDAGLIFLSAMASDLVYRTRKNGGTDEEVVATVLVLLGLATFTLGIMVWVIGKLRFGEQRGRRIGGFGGGGSAGKGGGLRVLWGGCETGGAYV